MLEFDKLSRQQFLDGMNLCLRNARQTLRESNQLYEISAYRRACALGIISIEEASKVVLLTMFSNRDRHSVSKKTMRKLAQIFRSHRAKQWLALPPSGTRWKGIIYVRKRRHVNEDSPEFRRAWRRSAMLSMALHRFMESNNFSTLDELKLSCLYVDIDTSAPDFCSSLSIPRNAALGVLDLATNHLEDVGELRDMFRRSKADTLSKDTLDAVLRDFRFEQMAEWVSSEDSADL